MPEASRVSGPSRFRGLTEWALALINLSKIAEMLVFYGLASSWGIQIKAVWALRVYAYCFIETIRTACEFVNLLMEQINATSLLPATGGGRRL